MMINFFFSNSVFRPNIYFKNLTISNVRSFNENHFIDFSDKDGKPNMWNVIIGDNGIGKTTVLKCLALTLINPFGNVNWAKFSIFKTFERFDTQESTIKIGIDYDKTSSKDIYEYTIAPKLDELELSFKNQHRIPSSELKSACNLNLFAYGAARKIGIKGISVENDFPALSLFDDNVSLLNIEEWLIQSEYKALKNNNFNQHKKVIDIIKILLEGEISEIKVDTETASVPKVLFKTNYGWVKLHELSLGYKTLLAWIVDFAKGMVEKYPQSETPLVEQAICLVDEIDLHIHPSLQRKLIEFLTSTFPKTQFIVTAHSPLIVQSLNDANIIVLTQKGDSVEVCQNKIDIKNWRVDQILMSDLFGLRSSHSEETEAKLERRKYLLLLDNLSENERFELEELNTFSQNMPLGNSQSEIKGFDLMRQFAKELAELQKTSKK